MLETTEARSRIMRAVKSKDTAPELMIRRLAHGMGYRYRLHAALPGKPDLAFPARRAVIFVHGCFWHGHQCARGAREPKTNVLYWRTKIARNITRDRRVHRELRRARWHVLVLWECQLNNAATVAGRLARFLNR